jgi:prepilin-type N-terminal cleavage/methylation domain-containing protein
MRGQRGFVLIEVLMSVAIFGVISVAFLSALVTGYHGIVVAHDQTMAQSLTRTALENVSKMPFSDVDTTSDNVTVTSKFRVEIHADYVTSSPVTGGVAGEYEIVTAPSSLKMITVTIRYHDSGRTIWATQDIKVKP